MDKKRRRHNNQYWKRNKRINISYISYNQYIYKLQSYSNYMQVKNKDWTTVQIYKKDLKFLGSLCTKNENFRDKIEEILKDYKKCKK